MNPNREPELAAILQEALESVSVTRGKSERLTALAYRLNVLRYRNVCDPNLRLLMFTYRIHIEDSGVREAILVLLRGELEQFVREDRTYPATFALFGGLSTGSTVEDILVSLMKAAIVEGPRAAARAFYHGIAYGHLAFRHYFLLEGIRVQKEVQVFDGITLTPLPNSTADLPGHLSQLFGLDGKDFLSKTLLGVDYRVSPVLHKPEQCYTIQSGPEKHFDVVVDSADVAEFNPKRFFQALTFVGEHPVQVLIGWMYVGEEQVFDLRMGPGSGYSSFTERASSATFSEAQVRDAVDLYGKIIGLPKKVQEQLEIPVDRWMKSKTHQSYVDRMIDLGIAMESLYLRGIRDELSFRFRLRASLHLGDGIEHRRDLKSQFGRIYNYRSTAVHEGTLPTHVNVDGSRVPIRQFIERSQDLFKRSLLKVIESGQLPDWDSIELGG